MSRALAPGPIDVLGIGVAVRDITVLLDPFPGHDSKVRALDFAESGGGPVPTALVTVSRLGGKAAWAGALGDDEASGMIERSLADEGVDTSGVARKEGTASPASVILVERHGARRVCEWRQSELPFTVEDLGSVAGTLEACRSILVDARYPETQAAAAERIRSRGGIVAMDCGHPRPGVDRLLPLCHIAILSHSYVLAESGDGFYPESFVRDLARKISRDGPRIAGITLGEDGSILCEAGKKPVRVPAVRIPGGKAVDTTGAGDVFHGAFLLEWLRTESMIGAARFASAAAAFSCTGLTGRASLPDEAALRRAAESGSLP